jgi:hypothetical protein
MKFNKWTVALAAVGVVSLASAAKAEEKASTAVTALTPTSISGYVDTSAEWNPGTGNAHVPLYKFNSASKADGFNLDVVQLRIEKALDESEWAAGYRADLWFGPDANTLNTTSSGYHDADFAIRQAYVALRTPVGNGIDWKMGVFDSILGYESVESPNDPNYTRSYGHSIEPQTHTGLLGSYRFCDMFSASVGVANTMGPQINSRAFTSIPSVNNNNQYAESYKTYMGSVALTAPDSMGFLTGSTLYAGIVNGFNNNASVANPNTTTTDGMPTMNAYIGATVATPVTGLRVGAAWDIESVNTPTTQSGIQTKADVWSLALYASFQATEKLSLHGRAEYLSGDNNSSPGVGFASSGSLAEQAIENHIYAVTATVQYDLWKNVLSRLEFRWDHAEHGDAFGGTFNGTVTAPPNAENAFMLAANVIYKF